jgi:acyl dehydratase
MNVKSHNVPFLEDLEPGFVFTSAARTISAADLVAFADLSGDFNPLHVDEDYARARGFERRIAHGALVFSIATGLRQETGRFEGSMVAMLELRSWRFLAPVFVGDAVRAETTVVDVRPTSSGTKGVVVQRVDVRNQDGVVVQSGELVSLIAARRTETSGDA